MPNVKYLVLAFLFATGCEDVMPTTPHNLQTSPAPISEIAALHPDTDWSASAAFMEVVRQLEPVAERECRRRAAQLNCDFLIVVDDRRDQPANSSQTQTDDGRPIIVVTIALLEEIQNADELAYVIAFGAANHIESHLVQTQNNSASLSDVFGQIAEANRGTSQAIQDAQQLGREVGARFNNKEFVLEADRLGAIIAAQSGFDPVRGADYLLRTPSPEQGPYSFPSHAERIRVVARAAASLRSL